MKQSHHGGRVLQAVFCSGIFFIWPLFNLTAATTAQKATQPVLASLPVFADHAIVVKFKDTARRVTSMQSVHSNKAIVLHVSDPNQAIANFKQDANVEFVERDAKRYLMATPNDPNFSSQYYLDPGLGHNDIGATTAWDTTTGSKKVIVAILDTGMMLDHPDLVDNIWENSGETGSTAVGDRCWTGEVLDKATNNCDDDNDGYVDDVHGWNFADNNNSPEPTGTSSNASADVMVHGTHVAGIIGASGNNGAGVSGVNWQVSIMPLRVFSDDGSSDVSSVYNAITYAIQHGATILNMSYGGYESSTLENSAIQQAYQAGVLSVAAAGNETNNLNTTPEYPACYPHVLAVAATTGNDLAAPFTNYGTNCVGMAAPGEDIYSTLYTNSALNLTDQYGFLSGTSMSTPMVAGAAALLKSLNANFSPDTLISLLEKSADSLGDSTLGSGRLNLTQAVQAAEVLIGPPTPTITAYKNTTAVASIKDKKRTRDVHPFFSWKVDLSSSTSEVTGYDVVWSKTNLDPATAGTFQTSTTFQPPAVHGNNIVYYLNVRSVDALGKLSALASFSYRIDTKISRPTWGTALASKTGVQLHWHPTSDKYVKYYKVYRNTTPKHPGVLLGTVKANQTQFVDRFVKAHQLYYYTVRAIDDLGNKSTYSQFLRHKT